MCAGDELEIDLVAGEIHNLTQERTSRPPRWTRAPPSCWPPAG